MQDIYQEVKDRLITYAKMNTQSSFTSTTVPTTKVQFTLANYLYDELGEIGVEDRYYDKEKCVVYAKIPANTENAKALGLVAHMDTSPDAKGSDVKPWVLENYQGDNIVLNKEKNITMTTADFPNLLNYVGCDLVLTDGTTLLGGDDKAAIASVMTYLAYVIQHPEYRHGLISVAFTPDEEVGGLAKDVDLERFEAKTAYTIDGDYLGYYEEETFNASSAQIVIRGRSVHPGTAKDKMINAADVATEFLSKLPKFEKPQYTEGREGFYHVSSVQATCESASINVIVRDHDRLHFDQRNDYLQKIVENLNREYGENTLTCNITYQYFNMKEKVDEYPYLIDCLVEAIKAAGVTAKSIAFRGGTDGAALSWRGLPCPNLSAGYENAHGRFEFVPVQSMEKNVEILIHLGTLYTK